MPRYVAFLELGGRKVYIICAQSIICQDESHCLGQLQIIEHLLYIKYKLSWFNILNSGAVLHCSLCQTVYKYKFLNKGDNIIDKILYIFSFAKNKYMNFIPSCYQPNIIHPAKIFNCSGGCFGSICLCKEVLQSGYTYLEYVKQYFLTRYTRERQDLMSSEFKHQWPHHSYVFVDQPGSILERNDWYLQLPGKGLYGSYVSFLYHQQ